MISDTVRPSIVPEPRTTLQPVPALSRDLTTGNRTIFDRMADKPFQPVREEFFRNVQFTKPAGDPGWFGPGSAVWYVNSHLPTLQIAMAAAAMIETLHPDMAWMAYEHTRALERIKGVPTGNFDEKAMASRGGHTLSFFLGVAMGSNEVADRVTKTVAPCTTRSRVSGRTGTPTAPAIPSC